MSSRGSGNALRIDNAAECIWRDGEKIGVPPKAFLVLRRLMERSGQLVTKDELLEAVWPNTHVIETVLNNAVGQLREALGDDSKRPRFIETVHRRGFRWIGPVTADTAPAPPAGPVIDEVDLERRAASAFVGRAESLAELARCYARAAAGQRQLVLISGEPGIGKTALVERFATGLGVPGSGVENSSVPMPLTPNAVTPCLVASGQCIEAYGAGDPYRPLREAVEQLFRRGGEEARALLRTHAPSWLLSMPELSTPAELETLRRGIVASSTDSVHRELERALEAAGAARTLVLVLEDLHWSEPATVGLLWALAARREPARLMIVGTYRSADAIAQQHPITHLKRELTAKRQCIDLPLGGLPSDAVAALLDRRFQQHELSSAFAGRLCEQTTGNPLFLLNALADFERRGWLQEQEGVWRSTVDLDSLFAAVPESTRELIAFRLDQLSPSTRELLEAASVGGATFSTQTLAAATERGCAEVEAELEPLARSAFFLLRGDEIEWPDGTRGCQHEFRHALYRQVLLRGITPTRRQLLHRRIAIALERSYGDRVGELAGSLSLHHEQAGDSLRAVDYIDLLVQQAYARSAAHEAEAMLAHAVALLKRAPESAARQERLLKTTIAHGIALSTVRGSNSLESLHAYAEARALGQSMPRSLDHITTLGFTVAGKVFTGHFREARSLAEEMLALTRTAKSPHILFTAHLSAGLTLAHLGEIETARHHLERAVACIDVIWTVDRYDPSGSYGIITAHLFLGLALIFAGRPESGWTSVESALQLARATAIPGHLAYALSMASALAVVRRAPVETRRLVTAALACEEENDLAVWKPMNQVRLGWVAAFETRDPHVIEPMWAVVDAFRATGHFLVSNTYGVFADACVHAGRIEDATRALDAAYDTRGEERLFDADLFRLRGVILSHHANTTGALEEAEQCFQQAIEAAGLHGTRLVGLRATVDLCRLWLTTDRHEEARQRLTVALGAFDEGFDETDLREAKSLLDELSAE